MLVMGVLSSWEVIRRNSAFSRSLSATFSFFRLLSKILSYMSFLISPILFGSKVIFIKSTPVISISFISSIPPSSFISWTFFFKVFKRFWLSYFDLFFLDKISALNRLNNLSIFLSPKPIMSFLISLSGGVWYTSIWFNIIFFTEFTISFDALNSLKKFSAINALAFSCP